MPIILLLLLAAQEEAMVPHRKPDMPKDSKIDYSHLVPGQERKVHVTAFHGSIRDEDSWKRLWKGEPPRVDFKSHMVVFSGERTLLCSDVYRSYGIRKVTRKEDHLLLEVKIAYAARVTQGGRDLAFDWAVVERSELPVKVKQITD